MKLKVSVAVIGGLDDQRSLLDSRGSAAFLVTLVESHYDLCRANGGNKQGKEAGNNGEFQWFLHRIHSKPGERSFETWIKGFYFKLEY